MIVMHNEKKLQWDYSTDKSVLIFALVIYLVFFLVIYGI